MEETLYLCHESVSLFAKIPNKIQPMVEKYQLKVVYSGKTEKSTEKLRKLYNLQKKD